ncbi:MAG: hypothetical protein NTU58_00895 [Candidatus Nealsonbacteria bacterium]|nr:hypothetical protein [Candidatus Nealsonbacteria bacterium]
MFIFKKQTEETTYNNFKIFNKNIIILVSFLILIIFLLIIFSLYFLNKNEQKKTIPPISEEEKNQTQAMPKINVPAVLYNLFGTVEKIEEGKIIFKATIPQFDENNKDISRKETRKIILTPSTEIKSLVFLLDKLTGKTMPTEVKMSLEDIKIGDYVEVVSSKDIKNSESFEVKKITIINR